MAGYQFIHIETYGTTVSKSKITASARKKNKGPRPLTVREVIEEAQRRPGACPHVREPKKPMSYFETIALGQLADEVERRKKASKDILGRAIRKDAACMIGGVASFPIPVDQMQEDDWQRFDTFLERVQEFLIKWFGRRLVNVTVHQDETYPHVHFYVVPDAGEGTFTLVGLHPGIKARERVGKAVKGGAPELTKKRNAAYIEAMRAFQDDFYNEVAQFFEMQRFGPKRSRMSRRDWKTLQHQIKVEGLNALSDENERLKARVVELEQQVGQLVQRLEASETPEFATP